ncbi:MAG: leucyl aminopeptidase [Pirellulales bacterium]|nr:leucyl aminopeptidase [Pirellulales bacterium]
MPPVRPAVEITSESPTTLEADCVVVGLFDDKQFDRPAAAMNAATGGALARLIEGGDLSGKPLELVPLLAPTGIRAAQVLVVGLGPRENFDRGTAFRAAAAAIRQLAARARQTVGVYLADLAPPDLAESAVAGALAGAQGQDLYRREKKTFAPARLLFAANAERGLQGGQVLGDAMNLCRRLVNEPPQELYPEVFADRASAVAQECGLTIETWDQARLEAERCGALLAVARGSERPPRLVMLRYRGAGNDARPLALVGKGVTFDSGGLSLKPSESMLTMKMDMAGAATVLAAVQAIARLKLPVNVVGLMGLVENMPGGRAMKLGDVLWARNGRSIEVHNTDAEGRLVLADVLSVAVEQRAGHIVDLATLTGACVVALGPHVAGAMSNDQPWCDRVLAAARRCGEPAWQLPMFAEYGEDIKSDVADIKNVGKGRWGGAIAAAKFLEEFVAGTPWTHLDIAGPAFLESPKPWLDAGGTGCFVRTLVELARNYQPVS